jgi:hypothetical protein
MIYFLLGLVVLGLCLLATFAFVQVNPAILAEVFRRVIGILALALAVIFALTGRMFLAVPIAWVAFRFLMHRRISWQKSNKQGGQSSRVRTSSLEMILEHDTGHIDGNILVGLHAGKRLSELDLKDVISFRSECEERDLKAVKLIDAFLDRTYEDWHKFAGIEDEYFANGEVGSDNFGPMSREEAYEVLGLGRDSTKDDVRRAHRQLMKKLHPDQGGSTYLASKVNEAKDFLLDG